MGKKSTTTTNMIDNRQVLGDGSYQATNGSTINVTDGGAFGLVDSVVGNAVSVLGNTTAKTLNFADSALGQTLGANYDTTAKSLNFVDGALSQVFGVVGDALTAVKQGMATATGAAASAAGMARDAYADAKGRGAMTDYLILAGIAAAAMVAVYAVRKG